MSNLIFISLKYMVFHSTLLHNALFVLFLPLLRVSCKDRLFYLPLLYAERSVLLLYSCVRIWLFPPAQLNSNDFQIPKKLYSVFSNCWWFFFSVLNLWAGYPLWICWFTLIICHSIWPLHLLSFITSWIYWG